eukprot:4114216-Prymnesium_polylepis.1
MILGSLDASHMCSDRLVMLFLTRFEHPKTTKPPLISLAPRSLCVSGGPANSGSLHAQTKTITPRTAAFTPPHSLWWNATRPPYSSGLYTDRMSTPSASGVTCVTIETCERAARERVRHRCGTTTHCRGSTRRCGGDGARSSNDAPAQSPRRPSRGPQSAARRSRPRVA